MRIAASLACVLLCAEAWLRANPAVVLVRSQEPLPAATGFARVAEFDARLVLIDPFVFDTSIAKVAGPSNRQGTLLTARDALSPAVVMGDRIAEYAALDAAARSGPMETVSLAEAAEFPGKAEKPETEPPRMAATPETRPCQIREANDLLLMVGGLITVGLLLKWHQSRTAPVTV